MNESDRDLDEWVKALQGDKSATDPMATALREAIRAERAAEEMRLQPEVELAEQRLLARLRSEGLLNETKSLHEIPRATQARNKLLAALTQPLRNQWAASAVAAMVLLGIGIGTGNFLQHSVTFDATKMSEETIVRGEAMPVLVVDRPDVTAEQLVRQLEKLGAKTRVVPINENELILRIGVPAQADSVAILQLLQELGIKPNDPAPYRLSIKKQ